MEFYGNQIRFARRICDMSQKSLALCCHFKQQYLSDIERNKKNISKDTLDRIAKVLGMSIEELRNLQPYEMLQPDKKMEDRISEKTHEILESNTWERVSDELEYWKKRAALAEAELKR